MKNKLHPYLILISCCLLISVVYGFANVQGLFYDSISEELNLGKGNVSFYVTIIHVVGALVSPLGAKLRNRYSIRKIMAIWGSVELVTLLIIPMIKNIYELYLCACVLGIAQGLYGMVMVIELINRWFDKAGTFTGIALGFSGVFGTIFSPIIVDRIVRLGWRKAYYLFAYIFIAVFLFVLLVVNDKPKKMPQTSKTKHALNKNVMLIALYYIFGASITFVGTYILSYSVDIGLTMEQGSYLSSSLSVGNLVLKIVFGMLCDSLGASKATLINFGCICVGSIIMIVCPASAYVLLVLGTSLIGASFACSNVMSQALCKELEGKDNIGKSYADVSFFSLPYAFASTLIGFVYDYTNSYKVSIIGLNILFVISIALVLSQIKKKKAI